MSNSKFTVDLQKIKDAICYAVENVCNFDLAIVIKLPLQGKDLQISDVIIDLSESSTPCEQIITSFENLIKVYISGNSHGIEQMIHDTISKIPTVASTVDEYNIQLLAINAKHNTYDDKNCAEAQSVKKMINDLETWKKNPTTKKITCALKIQMLIIILLKKLETLPEILTPEIISEPEKERQDALLAILDKQQQKLNAEIEIAKDKVAYAEAHVDRYRKIVNCSVMVMTNNTASSKQNTQSHNEEAKQRHNEVKQRYNEKAEQRHIEEAEQRRIEESEQKRSKQNTQSHNEEAKQRRIEESEQKRSKEYQPQQKHQPKALLTDQSEAPYKSQHKTRSEYRHKTQTKARSETQPKARSEARHEIQPETQEIEQKICKINSSIIKNLELLALAHTDFKLRINNLHEFNNTRFYFHKSEIFRCVYVISEDAADYLIGNDSKLYTVDNGKIVQGKGLHDNKMLHWISI